MKFRFLFASASLVCGLAQTSADRVTIRQGETTVTLSDTAQRVLFVKSESDDPKAAIANTLLTQVGLNLLTMGMGPAMMRWNPYMGEAFSQFASIGKGLFTGHGNDVKGFEYDTLPGVTAGATLKPEPVEVVMPLETFRPSADFAAESVQPVLLRLETRAEDQVRIMASRRIAIKQEKKGRFDLKPKSERRETEVQERAVPVEVERQAGNVIRVTTRAALEPGEYALVLRARSESGAATRNVPLKPVSTPETTVTPAPPEKSKGLFGMLKQSQQPATAPATAMVGFLAWDFRVIE